MKIKKATRQTPLFPFDITCVTCRSELEVESVNDFDRKIFFEQRDGEYAALVLQCPVCSTNMSLYSSAAFDKLEYWQKAKIAQDFQSRQT